jgi:hypothetical protein
MRRHAVVAVANAAVCMLLALVAAENLVHAQADSKYTLANASDSDDSPSPAAGASAPTSSTEPSGSAQSNAPSSNRAESSLFYFLTMSGKTSADFTPLTGEEKVRAYAKGLFSPFHFVTAASAAGITQWRDVPHSWGQGAEGFGHRFGNYFAKQTTQRTLRLAGEELLHEDNRYFGSGEHSFGRRIMYAVKSGFLARKDDGTRRLSLSQIGSTAGGSFISRLWQPSTNSSAGDGAVSFGIGMATNAGTNILREFLPDITRHIFRRNDAN